MHILHQGGSDHEAATVARVTDEAHDRNSGRLRPPAHQMKDGAAGRCAPSSAIGLDVRHELAVPDFKQVRVGDVPP